MTFPASVTPDVGVPGQNLRPPVSRRGYSAALAVDTSRDWSSERSMRSLQRPMSASVSQTSLLEVGKDQWLWNLLWSYIVLDICAYWSRGRMSKLLGIDVEMRV